VAEGLDQEHALWLYDGPSSWNAFRRDAPDLTPLLDGVQLPPPGAATSLDDPYDMSLQDVDLHDAQLRGARIEDVTLARATFANADLTGAHLTGCSLRGSSFQGARLIDAEFARCDLDGADLSFATFGGTRFIGVDLARSTGHASTSHAYASIVDTRTFEMTSATLVQEPTRFAAVRDFLARLGLPQDLLDLLEVRVMEAGL
jgi:Pentapeptide repeats (8 copies)